MADGAAREVLYGRGVSDSQMRTFRLGSLGKKLPSLPEEATDFIKWYGGVLNASTYVFPLTTPKGVIGGCQFKARDRKIYQDFFLPGITDPVLFGLHETVSSLWETETAWLVEGVFDFFPIQRHYPSVLPVLTDKVTDSLLRFLKRFVRKVWVGFDMDTAGRRGAYTFKREHFQDFSIDVVVYPRIFAPGSMRPVKDVGELWEVRGDPIIIDLVKSVVTSHTEFLNA